MGIVISRAVETIAPGHGTEVSGGNSARPADQEGKPGRFRQVGDYSGWGIGRAGRKAVCRGQRREQRPHLSKVRGSLWNGVWVMDVVLGY